MSSITDLLSRKSEDRKPGETDRLFTLMYDDLCRLAGRFLQNEPLRNRLSSSSLVHQAYMRMVDQSRINWQGKTHFFAIGATVMRRILVDHARKAHSLKRGGDWDQRILSDEVTFQLHRDRDVMALDDLLQTLLELNPRQAKIVEMRFFGGMTMREIATEMNLGLRTVEKEWAMARAWMRVQLREFDNDSDERDQELATIDPEMADQACDNGANALPTQACQPALDVAHDNTDEEASHAKIAKLPPLSGQPLDGEST